MKHIAIIALTALPLFAACKKKEEKGGAETADKKPAEDKAAAKPEAPIELTATVDLGAAIKDPDVPTYKGLKAKAPAGAKTEPGLLGVLVRIGERQAFELAKSFEPGADVAKGKKEAQEDKLDKLVKFHIDTPQAILFESASELGGENNFHFVAEIKVGEDGYRCFNKGYGNFTKAQAEALLKSCQSVTK